MVDFVGTIGTATLVILVIGSLLVALDVPRSTKIVLAGVLGLWVGSAAAAAGAGWLSLNQPVPVMGVFVALPLLAAALVAATSGGRRALASLPMPLLVGLNIGRVVAALFLVLAAQGRLSGPFPQSAAWGDIVTGVLALVLLRPVLAGSASPIAVAAWNLFGIADLVAAISLGVMSGAGSPIQVFAAPGSAAMQVLPWSFVPTVLVPLYMIMHAVIFAQLRRISPSRSMPG